MRKKVTVLGAGAWGTALALQAHYAGNEVTLWAYLQEEKDEIDQHGENKTRLPGVKIPKEITVTCDLAKAAQGEVLLVVTPAQAIRSFLTSLKEHLKPETTLVFCSKGIEISTGALITDICANVIPATPIAVLSGPNFATEIATGSPGAATLASKTLDQAEILATLLSSLTFRIYPSDDIMGVQVGGALKNVVAIASGLVTGAGFGENLRAALITRGLEEMVRFGVKRGAKRETFMGLSGMGDLILCSISNTSRNMNFGFELGQGGNTKILLEEGHVLTEGAYTVKAVRQLTQEQGIDMPICEAVYRVLYEGKTIKEELATLLMRPPVPEII
ncbi:MAG: NAD(P)-dependent glycerol-3-phosphate dehydrogenase [Alphaproteobacteria bacterium]|nr:NAD(P)-dependent glycerol-3-phosphate dehydrogenase [Alphaproteobacteria bacterium]NCQ67174.1 NAD(P)-dependent glycerol-3-phosphate dehydrogenase [Alphaproteobacteria bacterium]NCT07019.1 NAD(P)-dependent glycerol-3-phosphate dehydrogenase [Alphaproteobacteria bacterium]